MEAAPTGDTLSFRGRVAVVTGAGRGLGRAHALLLASRGAKVVVNDLGTTLEGSGSSKAPADEVADEIVTAGGEALPDYNDVSTVTGGSALVERAVQAYGRIDIVLNNAGILRDAPMERLTAKLWDPVLSVHLRGAYCVTQPAWRHMLEQGYGRIVNTTSDSGLFGTAGHANYAAAKMGLVGFTRVLALEGAPHGIKANALSPLGVSRMTRIEQTSDLRNETVAAVAAWLAHESCSVSGETISVRRDRVSRIVVGITTGYVNADLTLEDVPSHLGEIWNAENLHIPAAGGR